MTHGHVTPRDLLPRDVRKPNLNALQHLSRVQPRESTNASVLALWLFFKGTPEETGPWPHLG